ncbi:hypothetical protein [Kribbella sindirgiensis]|nr:hypothetical protein [Kribbella sindirgiensis]
MHLHLAFGDFVLLDLELNSSLLTRSEPEPDLEEEEPEPLGFQAPVR